MATVTTAPRIAQAGKFLAFVLGEDEYGLEILKVQEINGLTGLTRTARFADHVRGVINLRGRVIPVVSLRQVLRMPTVSDTEKTCIIVVQVQHTGREITMGIIVDEVTEVLNIGDGRIGPPPGFGGGLGEAGIIAGIGQLENRVVTLLDIDCVMSGLDIDAALSEVQEVVL
jgi:purine-binding chemotaxis protein CheW